MENNQSVLNNLSMDYDLDNNAVKYSLQPFPEFMEELEEATGRVRICVNEKIGDISDAFIGYNTEDLSHQFFPGLYAQMLYGESFEDFPMQDLPAGWDWHAEPINNDTPKDPYLLKKWRGEIFIENGVLSMIGCRQRRIYTKKVEMKNGYVECELFQPSTERGYHGPGILACFDFDSYYYLFIAPERNIVSIGKGNDQRFVQSAKTLGYSSTEIEYDRWYRLGAKFTDSNITVTLDGKELFTCFDPEPLTGGIGLESSFVSGKFKNLKVIPEDQPEYAPDFSEVERDTPVTAKISRWWDPIVLDGADADFAWCAENPYNTDRCQMIQMKNNQGIVGVYNTGLHNFGLHFKKDHIYHGRLYLRGGAERVLLRLEDGEGRVLGQTTLTGIESEWKRFDFDIPSDGTVTDGRFSIVIDKKGVVYADQVILYPDKRDLYKGINIRRDIAEYVERTGVSHIRFGGDMINIDSFNWKWMLGDPDLRRQYMDGWNYHKSAQFMMFEFLEFAEAMGVIPIMNLAEHYDPVEIAEFVEYVNGSADTYWGAQRVKNGRPESYGLKYMMFGNGMPPMASLKKMAELVKKVDPDIQIITGDIGHMPWSLLTVAEPDLAKEFNTFAHIYDIVSSRPEVTYLSSFTLWDTLIQDARKGFPCLTSGTKLYAEEVNGGYYDWQRGLCNASFAIVSENNADVVFGQSYCNMLQASGHLYEWNQGSIHFNNNTVWYQPSGYAIQVVAQNTLDTAVKTHVECAQVEMDQRSHSEPVKIKVPVIQSSATISKDGKELCVKVVSMWGGDTRFNIKLEGFTPATMDITTIASRHLKGENTAQNPEYIAPNQEKSLPCESDFHYTLKPCSFTVFRFKK